MSINLILGPDNDHHALHILKACHSLNHPALLFDCSAFPTEAAISWQPHQHIGVLHIQQQDIPFSDIHSVFWSCLSPARLASGLSTHQHQIARNDAYSTLRTLLEEPRIHWINPWRAYQYHKVKPRQLAHALRLGAKIPATFVGNNVQQVQEFCKQVGRVIYKPVYGGAHTRLVDRSLLEPQRLAKVLSISPVTLQQFIPGTNVRSYVIGDHIFSAEIDADSVDFRESADQTLRPVKLSESEQQLARRITRGFGMCWTAIDWRRDSNGDLYFLEANPSPMFMYFEHQTGYAITEAILALMGVNKH